MNVEAFINQQVRLSHLPNLLFVGAKLRFFFESAIGNALIFSFYIIKNHSKFEWFNILSKIYYNFSTCM